MRVTHIITRLVIGGAQENTVSTVLGLGQIPGVKVDLISGPTTGPEGSMEGALGAMPGVLTRVPSLVRPVHPWKDARALGHLTALLRDMRSDVVHTHSGKAGILGRLAARRAQIPVVIHHIHGPSFGPFQGKVANGIFRTAERYAAGATHHFLCSAQAMARLYLAAGIGHPGMYTRLFSGFNMDPFLAAGNDPHLRQKLGIPMNAFVVGKIARLAPLKGHDDALIAAEALLRQCSNIHLLFVGDGPLRTQLENRVRASTMANRVTFTGLVPPNEVAPLVGIMDCVIHLSYREALSRALPQALAAGKPVIAYDFDGADEVCLHEETGFLVKTGDAASVSKYLSRLERHPDERDKLGMRGRRLVEKEFRVEEMIQKIYRLYVQLSATRTKPVG